MERTRDQDEPAAGDESGTWRQYVGAEDLDVNHMG